VETMSSLGSLESLWSLGHEISKGALALKVSVFFLASKTRTMSYCSLSWVFLIVATFETKTMNGSFLECCKFWNHNNESHLSSWCFFYCSTFKTKTMSTTHHLGFFVLHALKPQWQVLHSSRWFFYLHSS
jgi:hypothetical protein